MARLATWLALLWVAAVASAGPGPSLLRLRARLEPTGIDPDARGGLRFVVQRDGGRQVGTLKVRARRLVPGQLYDITVRGVPIGELETNGRGTGRARFRSVPRHAGDQELGVDPRGERLAVSDGGDDVLVADLGGGIPGSGFVRCCYDDAGGGSECDDENTERECVEYDGRSLGPGTCLPDPCGGTGQPPIPCCEGDDEAAVCSLETPSDCSLLDGVAPDAASCDPDPCASRPPGAGEIRCCIPPRRILGLPTCAHLTDADCVEQDGVSIGPGSCSANPCLTSASAAFVESPVQAAAVAGMPHRTAGSAPRPR